MTKITPYSYKIMSKFGLSAALMTLYCAFSTNANADGYINQLIAPVSSYTGNFDPNISINDAGNVSYVAYDAIDSFNKVFLSKCPIPDHEHPTTGTDPLAEGAYAICNASQTVSFFGGTRQFLGSDLNNLDPPDILSRDRVSGAPAVFLLRIWHSGTGLFTLLGKSPTDFSTVTSFSSLADDGTAVAYTADSGFNPGIQYYFSGAHSDVSSFSAGTLLRPQVAKDASNLFVLTDNAKGVLQYDKSQDTLLLHPRVIADASLGYTSLGTAPGISSDGSVTSFYADVNGVKGLYISIDAPLPIAGVAKETKITPVITMQDIGVSDLTASSTQRIPVLSKKGALFTSKSGRNLYYQLVTVVFSGSIRDKNNVAQPGIYSRDLLLGVFFDYINLTTTIKVEGISKTTKIASSGDKADGVTLSSNFQLGDSISSLSLPGLPLHDGDEQSPLVAFTATSSANQTVGIRSRRVCTIPQSNSINYKQTTTNWAGEILSGGSQTLSQGGCQVTSIGNLVNYFAKSSITPGDTNKLLGNQPYIAQAGGLCFPNSGTSCALGPYQQIGAQFMPHGNALIEGAIPLIKLFAGPSLSAFKVDTNIHLSTHTSNDPPLAPTTYPIYSNVNLNPLAPAEDFFLCNQEPIVVRVPNCKGSPETCTQHFVLARGKTIEPTGGHATLSINDPGYQNSSPTDLINVFGTNRERRNTVGGIRAISSASLSGKISLEHLMVLVDSPISLVISDPLGRKFGYDSSTGTNHLDILNAEITDEGFADPDGVNGIKETTAYWIGGPEDAYGNISGNGYGVVDGSYTLNAVGTGSGSYTISIQSRDSSGNVKTRYVAGTTITGQKDTIFVSRSSLIGTPLTVTSAAVPNRIPGDVLLHGVVNINDIRAITSLIGRPADGTDDPMDIDHDGSITALDARKAAVLCTKPRCAI